jgi:hypothetical protein
MAAFPMRPFLPTPRETNLLVVLGFAALGCGLYLRHAIVDAPTLELACAAGLPRVSCALRRAVSDFREMQLFGGIAIVAAISHFVRPRLVAFAVALCAAIFGLLLANNELSAIAIGLLVVSFARAVRHSRTSKPQPVPTVPSPTIAPASSKSSH